MSSYPLVYLPVAAALRSHDPALEEVSRSLGRSQFRTFLGVVLPQLWPAIAGGGLLVALHMLAEFGALSLLRFQTFTTAIFEEYELAFSNSSAAVLAGVLLALCVPLLAGELALRRNTRYARVGSGVRREPKRIRLGSMMPVALCGFVLLALLALGFPAGMLLYWLLSGNSAALPIAEMVEALGSSVGLSLDGAVLTTAFAIPLVLIAVRRRGAIANLADRLPFAVHALPGIVVALALAYFAIRFVRPVYQSSLVVMVAYAILYLPLAQAALRASVEHVPVRLEEVARSLGRGPAAAFMTVTLPNILPGVGAGTALIFLELMRELTATLILAPTGINTLAMEVWAHTNNMEYAAAAPYAATLVLASGLPVLLLIRRAYGLRIP